MSSFVVQTGTKGINSLTMDLFFTHCGNACVTLHRYSCKFIAVPDISVVSPQLRQYPAASPCQLFKAVMDSEGAASTLCHPYILPSHSQLSCYVGDWREAHDNSRDKGQQHRNQYHRLTSSHFKVLWIKAAAKQGGIMWMEKWPLFLRRWLIARFKQ